MLVVFSEKHWLHAPKQELHNGIIGPPYETPDRAGMLLKELEERKSFDIIEAEEFSFEHILRIHDADYLRLLEHAWDEWHELGREGDALPANWAAGHMRTGPPPFNLDGRLGYYSFSGDSVITSGTWEAALASADTALTGMDLILGGIQSAFSLCRPPGHHASVDLFGGYCYLNNAAIAAGYALHNKKERVAILDVDYHHGNGTQDIFSRRRDVLVLSIHADPLYAFPYFTGFAGQQGEDEGKGFTVNYPLSPGTMPEEWFFALDNARERVASFAPDVLIVSLGVDTYRHDPLSTFRLDTDDFTTMGKKIGHMGIPTLFVMEGGYAIKHFSTNVCNVLEGFSGMNR